MRTHTIALSGVLALTSPLVAQLTAQPCGTWTTPFGSRSIHHDETIWSLTTWDADGDGPEPRRLIASGEFQRGLSASLVYWDDETGLGWRELIDYTERWPVWLTTWDPDGDGPAPEQLASAAGQFAYTYTSGRLTQIASSAVLTGEDRGIICLTSWDPDGDGPLGDWIIVAGGFEAIDGIAANNIAAWDGTGWRAFGLGVPRVGAVAKWDPDGPGGADPILVAASGASIYRWVSPVWERIVSVQGAGVIRTLDVWDPDGNGPQETNLVFGGDFRTASGVSEELNGIGLLSSTGEVTALGQRTNARVESAVSWDPDGPGPAPPELIVGSYGAGVSKWDGSRWHALDSGATLSLVGHLVSWDADGAGPNPPRLVAASPSDGAYSRDSGAIEFDGASWRSLGTQPNGSVGALVPWDADGPGPEPTSLLVGGQFESAGVRAQQVAAWHDSWRSIGQQLGQHGAIVHVSLWDPDDLGIPIPVLGGSPQYPIPNKMWPGFLEWNGEAWTPMRGVTAGHGGFVHPYDADGPGGDPPIWFATGRFDLVSGGRVEGLGYWDGVDWQSMDVDPSERVFSLCSWDPDGAGPAQTELIVGGNFTSIGGEPVTSVARWNGLAWSQMGEGWAPNTLIYNLLALDPDGDGPRHADLLAVGYTDTYVVRRWDGEQWEELASYPGRGFNPACATVWDPDGTGPSAPMAVFGSWDFSSSTGEGILAAWSEGRWRVLPPSPFHAFGLAELSPLPIADGQVALATWGRFDAIGETPAPGFALYTECCYADCTRDNTLDIFDFLCFQDLFTQADPQADCTRDGTLDILDFLCYQDAFTAGCP